MSGFADIVVTPTQPDFVARVHGLDCARPLAADTARALHAAFARYPVLVLPEQTLDPGGLERFAASLGPFGEEPYVVPLAPHPHVIEVRREAHETTPIFGSAWHSDWSFQAAPPSATLLYAAEIPPIGGDTWFADTALAWEACSPVLQDMLAGLRGVHTAAPAYGPRGLFARDDATRSMAIRVARSAERRQAHPLVRRHPVSGRLVLFLNPVYTVAIEGLHEAESRALLDYLCSHLTRPEFTYRHRWRAGMLVMWDNRRVLHRADGGYAGYRRLMYRATLAGDAPRAF